VTVERQPSDVGLALRDPYPWEELAELARQAERGGFSALFLPEITARDTLAAITGLAGETSRLLLGTGVVPLPSRTIQLLAMAAVTAQERSGGRLVLGLGTGPTGKGALDRLRRTVLALRAAFAGERPEIDGARIDLSLLPALPPRIWVAALGPRAVRLAGEIADGVLLNWCTPERVARARSEVAEGAAISGRDPAEVTVGVYLRASLGPDAAAATAALKFAAGEYAGYPAYARQLSGLGLGDEAAQAAAVHRAGRSEEVPERLVRAVCLPTDPPHARARLEAYRAAGADLPIVYPVLPAGREPFEAARATLHALAPRV
jgi:alkanesulfonate monooxygenase SsuD/methylene tetrahydromethanopterin reductase-like flavin-dependent oxidoreductase (luciferase family)